jgi:hypothetical protein
LALIAADAADADASVKEQDRIKGPPKRKKKKKCCKNIVGTSVASS